MVDQNVSARLKSPSDCISIIALVSMHATTHSDGLLFGPTASGKTYLSMYDHRGRNHEKSCWSQNVPPPAEYSIFEQADDDEYSDINGHYWGILDALGSVLGTRGERLAKFPFNAITAMPWHGYPVSPASGRASEIPPDELVENLIEAGAVSRTFGRKLQRRKA